MSRADILAPANTAPDVATLEAMRVRRIALQQLRSKQVANWTAQSLCVRARCKREVAQSALNVLSVWGHIVKQGDGFVLAPVVLDGGTTT